MDEPQGLVEWAAQVPAAMRDDPIWRLPAYRYSLFLGDLVQADVHKIRADVRTRRHIDQLLDAVGSISANIAEGYSRTTGPERAKFYEYAHSSAREAREWLFKVRHALGPDVATARILLATRIMKILAVVIPRERADSESRARRWERSQREPHGQTELASDKPDVHVLEHPASPSDQHDHPAPSSSPCDQHDHPATS
jgi:four helix bundle protein